jgi:hypothetical protein
VVSILYGAVVAFVAYVDRPRIEWLHSAWFSEAAEAIATVISKAEGKDVKSYQVRTALLEDSDNDNIAWLEKVATSPSEKQKLFSLAVKQVNDKHKTLIAKLPERQREYWLLAFTWWVPGGRSAGSFPALAKMRSNSSIERVHSGLRPPWSAYVKR